MRSPLASAAGLGPFGLRSHGADRDGHDDTCQSRQRDNFRAHQKACRDLLSLAALSWVKGGSGKQVSDGPEPCRNAAWATTIAR